MVPEIFISYSRDDLSRINVLVSALRAEDFEVWWDQDIEPNAPWAATIDEKLRAARLVIVAWSPTAILSDNVMGEARWAKDQGKLLQVFVRPCRPPLFFGERQGIDLTDWFKANDGTRLGIVVQFARAHLKGKGASSRVPHTREILRLLAQLRNKRTVSEDRDWFYVIPLVEAKGIRASTQNPSAPVPIRVGSRVKLLFDLKKASTVGVITIDGAGIFSLDAHLSKERKLSLPRGKTEFFGPRNERLAVHPPSGEAATVAFAIGGPLKEQIARFLQRDPLTPHALLELLQQISQLPEPDAVICPYFYSVTE
jgi:hypothetical protein